MSRVYTISRMPPPCYKEAQKRFGVNFYRDGVVFTYGATVHVYKGDLTPDLIVHEKTHIDQQMAYEGGPAAWWKRYLDDDTFRLEQELEAYRAQWRYARDNYRKSQLDHHLNFFAKSLVAIYRLPNLDLEKAKSLIRNG